MLSFTADRGAAATVAYAHHNSNRNVFGEWVFGCQVTSPIHRKTDKGQRVFVPLCPYPQLSRKLLPSIRKNFFDFF